MDAAVGLKAMHQMSRLQKAKDKIAGLAATDLTWLDDALKPSDSSAPSASAAKPPSVKARKLPIWEEHFPTKEGKKKSWSALDKHIDSNKHSWLRVFLDFMWSYIVTCRASQRAHCRRGHTPGHAR